MSLLREDLWLASWCLRSTIPASVRDISCSTPASWLASASSCLVCALRFPDSSISSDPCFSSTDGLPEVSRPAIEVAPLSSNAAAAVAATLACAVWNWALAWRSRTRTWLTVGCGAASAPVAKTATLLTEMRPTAIAIPRRIRDALPASRVLTSLPLPTMSPLTPAFAQVLDLATGPATFGASVVKRIGRFNRFGKSQPLRYDAAIHSRNEIATLASRGFGVGEALPHPGPRPRQDGRARERKPQRGDHARGREDAERLHFLFAEIAGRRRGDAG